jgi:hypothetical protein
VKAPFGARELEYVAFRFAPEMLAKDLSMILEYSKVCVKVNGVVVAESMLHKLPMEPPMSGRVVFRIAYAVAGGDEITCAIHTIEEVRTKGGVDLEAELSIIGEQPRRMVWLWMVAESTSAADSRAPQKEKP